MSSDHVSGPDPGQGLERHLTDELARFPRLDAEGMVAEARTDERAPAPLDGPSPLLPALVATAGVALTVLGVVEAARTAPAAGQARPMNELVLAAALALGGYSLTRVLQLLTMVESRPRR
ncbi:MAG: hypothetical protein L0H39_07350, partial [Brachybacterium sp.]|nr:hypothetical protein [Brachybacterium sp.]